VHLNARGERQAAGLADRLASLDIRAVFSSPLERAIETAAPIAACHDMQVRVCEELNEIDFGQWTGRNFQELSVMPAWRAFNAFRSSIRIPGGESMVEVQERAVTFLQDLSTDPNGDIVALVSHGDVIKAALCHYAGISLDLLLRLSIDPCSVSSISVTEREAKILCMNYTGSLSF
jgi:probable phosphoglycerate mutase